MTMAVVAMHNMTYEQDTVLWCLTQRTMTCCCVRKLSLLMRTERLSVKLLLQFRLIQPGALFSLCHFASACNIRCSSMDILCGAVQHLPALVSVCHFADAGSVRHSNLHSADHSVYLCAASAYALSHCLPVHVHKACHDGHDSLAVQENAHAGQYSPYHHQPDCTNVLMMQFGADMRTAYGLPVPCCIHQQKIGHAYQLLSSSVPQRTAVW